MDTSVPKKGEAANHILEALRQRLAAHATIIKFLIVGGIGYLVYQSVLFAVYDGALFPFLPDKDVSVRMVFFDHGDVRLLIASLVAMEFGVTTAFIGHHRWTFRDRGVHKPVLLRYGQFHANQLISALGILTVTVNLLTVQFGFYHFLAVPIGMAMAGSWNWLFDSQVIWRRTKRRDAVP
jgi:putative flippase GtrA